jgi:hypothetical protein
MKTQMAFLGVVLASLALLPPTVFAQSNEDKSPVGGQSLVLPKDDPFFGTWISEERDKSERTTFYGRFVISQDLHELDYKHISDTEPIEEGWLTPEKTWIDGAGNHWYKLRSVGWVYPGKAGRIEGFFLCRISADGKMIESVWMESGYPDDITPLGPDYSIYYRQN